MSGGKSRRAGAGLECNNLFGTGLSEEMEETSLGDDGARGDEEEQGKSASLKLPITKEVTI